MTHARQLKRQGVKARVRKLEAMHEVGGRIFSRPAPNADCQARRVKLIEELLGLARTGNYEPRRLYETVARNRHAYDPAKHGESPIVDWFDRLEQLRADEVKA